VPKLVRDREAAARLGLVGVHDDPTLGRKEHPGAVDLGLVDGKTE
jgi:hypothetical protein